MEIEKEVYTLNEAFDQQKKQTSMSINDFDAISVLGKGTYATVVLVRKKSSGKLYAMKMLKKKLLKEKRQIQHTKTER